MGHSKKLCPICALPIFLKNVTLDIMRKIIHLGTNLQKQTELLRRIGFNQKFRSAVETIKTEFHIPKREDMAIGQGFLFTENPKLIQTTKELIKSFDIPKNWEENVLGYIVYDEFFFLHDPDVLSLEIESEKKEADKKFYLRIFPDTSIKDIKDVWFLIQKEINPNGIRPKKKKYKKLDRDMEIYYLHLCGNSIPEISTKMKTNFPNENLDHGNIKVIISNFKKIT